MKTVYSLALSAALISTAFAATGNLATSARLFAWQHENVLGTSFEIKLTAANQTAARQGEAAALAEIDRQAKILSAYDSASEFSRWTRTRNQDVKVSPNSSKFSASSTSGAPAPTVPSTPPPKSSAASGKLPPPHTEHPRRPSSPPPSNPSNEPTGRSTALLAPPST